MSLATNLRTLLLACAFSLAAANSIRLCPRPPEIGCSGHRPTVATAPASLQLTFSEGVDLEIHRCHDRRAWSEGGGNRSRNPYRLR